MAYRLAIKIGSQYSAYVMPLTGTSRKRKTNGEARYIEEGRLRHMLKVAVISGEFPLHNFALLTTVYGANMKLTEIGRMPVCPYLNGDGSVRLKSSVDVVIAYNGKERPIYWSNAEVVEAIDADLAYRVTHLHRVTPMATSYRGLDPDGPIFLTGDREPYKLIARSARSGAVSYSCDSRDQLFRKLHLQAGIAGASAMSGHRTFTLRLADSGFDRRHINELLGLETLIAMKRLIDADPVRPDAIVARVM